MLDVMVQSLDLVSNGTKKGLFVVFDDAVNHQILAVFVPIHEPDI